MRLFLKGRYEIIMKHNFKKILTVCLIASLAVTAFGCSSTSENGNSETVAPQETISLDQTKQSLTFVHDVGTSEEVTEAGGDAAEGAENAEGSEASGGTATTAAGNNTEKASTTSVTVVPATEYVKVTDDKGQPVTDANGQEQTEVVTVTEFVPVTEANGQPVTDTAGQPVTEAVPVTETVVVTEPVENPATFKPNEGGNTSAYTPSYDLCKAYWLDMSQEGDFLFEGEFLIIEFEVNKDIPDGSYPITIEKADIASWEVKSYHPQIINGEVAVNTDVTAQADFPADDFALKVNSVSAKQGDTVKVAIDLKNNPGFCGFVIDVKYDKSAMTIVDSYGGENFVNTAINYVAN